MADEREIIAQQAARIAQLEAAERVRTVEHALGAAIDAAGVDLHPPARGQLVALLADKVALVPTPGGTITPTGPDLKPLGAWVQETLASDRYVHYRRGGGSPAPGGSSSPAAPVGEARNMSEAILADHRQRAASTADPRLTGGAILGGGLHAAPQPAAGFGLKAVHK
jgi:hypothetical protein